MNTAIEETAQTAAEKPKASKKASVGRKGAHVPPKKGKAAKHAGPTKKAPKAAKEKGTRDGSKAAKILELLKRPDGATLSELMKATGWQVVAVPGLIPDAVFFDHLAHRRFVAGNFIRRVDQIDYLEEPDVFHDVFGHVPLLALPDFADYMQAYGRGGLRAVTLGAIDRLSRLYWYTVEFGLVRSRDGLRIYGSGIASSRGETVFALENPAPRRIGFDLERVMRTPYRIDDFQQCYFVIDSFADLRRRTEGPDFAPIYERLGSLPDIDPGVTLPEDQLYAAQ